MFLLDLPFQSISEFIKGLKVLSFFSFFFFQSEVREAWGLSVKTDEVFGLELCSSLNILRSAFSDIHTSRKVTVWEYVHVMPEHHLCICTHSCVYTAHMELGKSLFTQSNGDGQRASC